tara:strand:+ start:1185 stop:1409 length:225 start_codon:yes stop_codon:yes gene_type:complete
VERRWRGGGSGSGSGEGDGEGEEEEEGKVPRGRCQGEVQHLEVLLVVPVVAVADEEDHHEGDERRHALALEMVE